MAYQFKSSWNTYENTEYLRLEKQIEQETRNLLRERQLYNNPQNYFHQQLLLKHVESQHKIKPVSEINQTSRHQKVSQKLYDLVNLSQHQKYQQAQNLANIVRLQKNIQSTQNILLKQNLRNSAAVRQNTILQAQIQSSLGFESKQQLISRLNISPKIQNPRSMIKQAIIKNSKLQIGDDVLQMIEEIEVKALNEIQKLKEDKLELMRQLKKEIQSNNQLQKQINSNQSIKPLNLLEDQKGLNKALNLMPGSLQQQMLLRVKQQMDNLIKENQYMHKMLNNIQNAPSNPQNISVQVNSLRNKVFFYENELRKRDRIIQDLMARRIQSNNFGQISQLLDQGEFIRKDTLHLINLKLRNHQNSIPSVSQDELYQRIQELQDLLYKEEEEKQSFLSDLLSFKQKYQQLQDENMSLKRLSQNAYSNIRKMPSFSPIFEKQSESIEEYQRVISEIKRKKY